MADDCVFCRIVRGEIPSQKVFENDQVVAILDIGPIAPGHTLVIAKPHVEAFTDLAPELLAELSRRTQEIARGVLRAMGAPGFNLLMNNHRCSGQAIPHVHWHIIPRKDGDGVRFNWAPNKYEGDQMARTADAIRQALR